MFLVLVSSSSFLFQHCSLALQDGSFSIFLGLVLKLAIFEDALVLNIWDDVRNQDLSTLLATHPTQPILMGTYLLALCLYNILRPPQQSQWGLPNNSFVVLDGMLFPLLIWLKFCSSCGAPFKMPLFHESFPKLLLSIPPPFVLACCEEPEDSSMSYFLLYPYTQQLADGRPNGFCLGNLTLLG